MCKSDAEELNIEKVRLSSISKVDELLFCIGDNFFFNRLFGRFSVIKEILQN